MNRFIIPSSPGRLVRILSTIVGSLVLGALKFQAHVSACCAIRPKLVGDQDRWGTRQFADEVAQQPFDSPPVVAALNKSVGG